MKRIFTTIMTLGSLTLLMLASCKKDETKVVATAGTSSTLTASTTTPVLTKASLTATSVTFTGTAPSYGYSSVITNTLQVAVTGTSFAKPTEVALATGTISQTYTVKDFNNMLLALNLATGTSAKVDVRIKSSLSTTAGVIYSNVVTLSVTPFALVSYVYVPGAYQGWNPAVADSLQSAAGNGVYTGIITFAGSDQNFKITPAKNWNASYGDAGGGKVSLSAGNNILAPGAGSYVVTVDTNAGTIAFSAVPYYYSVIGDAAIDWGTDVDMKYNNGTTAWELTRAFNATGGFKVRLNHDWGTSWGFLAAPDGSTLTSNNGGNMSVSAAGTYKLTFTPTYDATSGKPVTTAKYTLVKQ